MSPSLLRTPCTGHSVCLPQPRHCLLSSKERWGITLSHAAPHSRPVIGHVTTVLSSDWLMTQAAGEGGSRKGRGRGGLLFVYLDKTPDLIIGNTRHWYLISSSEKNGRISMYFATFLLKNRRSNVIVWMCIWWFDFDILFYRISLILLLSSGSVTCLPSVNNVQVLFPPLCCYTLL